MKSLSTKVAAGIVVGGLCSALLWIPQLRDFEQEVGLQWLFTLRGPVEPPKHVVLVTMSQRAARNIFLPRDPEKYHRCIDLRVGAGTDQHENLPPIPARWPRCLHALLIEKLNRAGVSTIVFDVLFRQRAPQVGLRGDVYAEQDAMLARAMETASNVVIAQKIEQVTTDSAAHEQPLLLNPEIESAALGAGPFQILPSASRRIDVHYVFQEEGWATPGLPAVALQAYAMDAYPAFRVLLAGANLDAELLPADAGALKRSGRLQTTGLLLRQIFKRDASLAGRLNHEISTSADSADESRRKLLNALVSAYGGESSRLLNFVGPSGAIPAIEFDRVLAMPEPVAEADRKAFGGKVVFVGFAEAAQAEQVEHFRTVFSDSNGIDLSGVEIAATAFVNLLEDSSIRRAPLRLSALIVFGTGLAATLLCLLLTFRVAIPVTVLLTAGYTGAAVHLFSTGHLWLPVFVPLFISMPAGIFYAITQKYSDTRRQRDRVRAAFRHFVPAEVAEELERNAGRILSTRKSLDCICVATDAAKFTTLAENMESEAVTDFLNAYFDSLFKPVIEHGGFISDVVGDAMLAIWPDRAAETRQNVCTALLEMREAAEDFNRRSQNSLSTRFGANWGRVTLATIGARAHYEYRAVGDPVNTASRIQELNKKLGTRILVSQSLLAGVEGFLVRDLGSFLLRGKRTPERIFELIDKRELASAAVTALASEFEKALNILHTGAGSAALAAFQDIQTHYPSDGATAFYINHLITGKPLSANAVVLD